MPNESVLADLFQQWAGVAPEQVVPLASGGSPRCYFRLFASGHSCIGAFNADVRENEAFFSFSHFFASRGFHVPQVFAIDPSRQYYIQQDLGDKPLSGLILDSKRLGKGFDASMVRRFETLLRDLVLMQQEGRGADFSKAYPRPAMDRQALQWDLNYFKYNFLKLADIPFDEQLLEDDFNALLDFLDADVADYFVFRDFQPRNIMLAGDDETPYYIDFQGARKGSSHYDVASLLFSASSGIPPVVRQHLVSYYFGLMRDTLAQRQQTPADFERHFYSVVLHRVLQTLGAYGYRGLFQRKDHFLSSIPFAAQNLRFLLEKGLPVEMPHLQQVLLSIADRYAPLATAEKVPGTNLVVTVCSFSYKQGLPTDPSGNGGGFLFDCRALPNPGRYPEYRQYTGESAPVIDFLKRQPAVDQFLKNAENLVDQSVEKYLERHFTHLLVGFGCTGGQHRSLYCAEQMAKHIHEKYGVEVVISHLAQKIKKNIK